ncbi:MAG TPA: glycosyltransferase family 4 protein [Terriglobia bacterium]|nr:glycosyltransferase family 4 protein [Terriglobia bacterium]
MKFLMVTHYFGSHQGGIELVAEKLFHGLARRGCEVVWAAADVTDPPSEVPCGSVLPLKTWNGVEGITGLPFPAPSISALRKLCWQVNRADLILLHDCLYFSNVIALLRARMLGVPVMVVQHIGMVPYRNSVLRTMMKLANALVTRPMLAAAQQVVFISQNTARYFASVNFRQPPVVVFNGVDTGIFRPLKEEENKSEIRERLRLPQGGLVVLFVGRFVEKKGLPALQRMVGMRPEWTWAFAGWGPLDPASWNAPNVRVFSNLRGDSIAALYRVCDLLVLPSTGEGFPLVVQEALAAGLPVVCGNDTLCADDAMRDFIRGAPVYTGDENQTAREFLRAIDELITSEMEESRSAERRAFAVSRYSWDAAAERYLEIASRLVSTAGSGAVKSKVSAEKGSQ